MKKYLDYILSDIVFITRLPIKVNFEYKSDQGNVKFFPLVGIILGFILFAVGYIFDIFNSFLVASIIITTHIFLTGGIHLDGLSDMSDGILSYRDRDKMIEIMKDSRIGAMGVIALILIIALKIFAVSEAILIDNLFYIILFPIYGRLGIVALCFFGKPIDKSRLGVGFIGNMKIGEFLFINIVYWSIINFIGYMFSDNIFIFTNFIISSSVTLIIIIFLMFYMVKRITHYIGGISGDILGAGCEISELVATILLCFLFLVFEKGM